MLMSLYTLGTQLEDPFDTGPDAPPDALSLLEFMHTLAYVSGWASACMDPCLRDGTQPGLTP
jgi:hypothetical protein